MAMAKVLLLGLLLLPLATHGTHFRGAIMMMRPVGSGRDRQMEISFQVAFRRDHSHGRLCSQSTIDSGILISVGQITCLKGCKEMIGSLRYQCTDFSLTENWSYGEGRIVHSFPVNLTEVTVGFLGRDWIAPFNGDWSVPVTASLVQRSDTGVINSSPRSIISPVIRVQAGCHHIIRIPVSDPDGDVIRCRWANASFECGKICNRFPNAVLDPSTCTIEYFANHTEGYLAAAVMIEDFQPGLDLPLSSVSMQFLVYVYVSNNNSCVQRPSFLEPTLGDGACVVIPRNKTFNSTLLAHSGGDGAKITEFITVSPPGMRKGRIKDHNNTASIYSTDITWNPEDDVNGVMSFCFSAVNSVGQTTEQRCVNFMPNYELPKLISVNPNNQQIHPGKAEWTLEFDKPIQRPSKQGLITFYDSVTQEKIESLDTSVLKGLTIMANRVKIPAPFTLPDSRTIYATIDKDAFASAEGCHPDIDVHSLQYGWTFSTLDVTPPSLSFQVSPSVVTSGNITITWSGAEPFVSTCVLHNTGSGNDASTSCLNNEWRSSSNLSEGQYELQVTVMDLSNNTGVESQPFKIDQTPPNAEFVRTPKKLSNSDPSKSSFQFVCKNEICKFRVRVLPGSPDWLDLPYAGPEKIVSYRLPAMNHDQEYVFQVLPVDRANNIGKMLNFSGRIDTMPPIISITEQNITLTCQSLNSQNPPKASDENGVKGLTFQDKVFPCFVDRTWTAEDNAGNVASTLQRLTLDTSVKIDFLKQITINCESSSQEQSFNVLASTASGSSKCYTANTPVSLSVQDSLLPEYYTCPGSFKRMLTAINSCTKETINATQTIIFYNSCPRNVCGQDESPKRGICVLGKCNCNKPWYGTNCEEQLLEPLILGGSNVTIEEGKDYQHSSTLIQGTQSVTWNLLEGPSGISFDSLKGDLIWSRASAGNYTIVIEARNEAGKHQVSWSLFVLPTYSAMLYPLNKTIYPFASKFALTGVVNFQSNSFIKQLLGSVVPVTIKITKDNSTITLETFSKPDGSFMILHSQALADYGHYIAFAKHPAEDDVPGQMQWDILGMSATPETFIMSGEAITDFTKSYPGICVIVNDGPRLLTQITAQVLYKRQLEQQGLFIDVTFQQNPTVPMLPVGSNATLDIHVHSKQPVNAMFVILVESFEGAKRPVTANLDIAQINPKLVIHPQSLNERLLRGNYKSFWFNITNVGKVAATNLVVKLPLTNVLTLQSFGASGTARLEPGKSATFSIQAHVAPDYPLGYISGRFGIVAQETSASIPFRITVTSNTMLNYTIIVEDEFTYFAAGKPYVEGAQVVLMNYGQGLRLEQYTDNTGSTTFLNITEDAYELFIQAPKHRSIREVVLPTVSNLQHRIFLERLAVRYSFSVTPVQIQDIYEIEVEADFETRVPMPVVTVDPNKVNLEPYELGYKDSLEFNITNHGLIRADNVGLQMPGNHPHLDFEVLVNIGSLEAETSVIVPVKVRRKQGKHLVRRALNSCPQAYLYYYVYCGGWKRRAVPIIFERPSSCRWGFISGGNDNGNLVSLSGASYQASTIGSCNPCINSLLCLIPTPPIISCIPNIFEDIPDANDTVKSVLYALKWISCIGIIGGPYGKALSLLVCAADILLNCGNTNSRKRRSLANTDSVKFRKLLSVSETLDELYDGLAPILLSLNFAVEILGDEKWLNVQDPDWVSGVVVPALSDTSDSGFYITAYEFQEILQVPPPEGISNKDVKEMLERVNNTLDGWNRGILEPSNSRNIPSHSKVATMLPDIRRYNEKAKQKGFSSAIEAYNYAANEIRKLDSWEEEEGVCAVVRIRLKQQLALTREAFEAALEIENKDQYQLTNISATITLTDTNTGYVATEKFSIGAPNTNAALQRIGSSTWALNSGSTGLIEWLLVPYSEAAPLTDTTYDVGGTLMYTSGSDMVKVPLLPARITVKPDPSLVVHYFWEKHVEADDPFTKAKEKSVPFSLGVLIKNQGFGSAYSLRLSSSEPEIIENEKGLKISFRIIGSTFGDQPRQPSLDVTIGDLAPNETVVIRWWMVSSLQGQFKNYSASFRNINPLGDEKLSLLEELKVHDLTRNVRLYGEDDDNILDFLVNERVDLEDRPEIVYDSKDLGAFPVFRGHLSHVSIQPQGSDIWMLTVESFANETGWNYYRLTDQDRRLGYFGGDVIRVVKDSNMNIPLENVWMRRHAKGNPRTIYYSLEIFDFATTANMTSVYDITICQSDCEMHRNATSITSNFKDPVELVQLEDIEPETSTQTTTEDYMTYGSTLQDAGIYTTTSTPVYGGNREMYLILLALAALLLLLLALAVSKGGFSF